MSYRSILLIAAALLLAPRVIVAQSDTTRATARCRDGTYSYSASRRGTCSHHGGVAEWLASAAATAKCADGTLSASVSRRGTCSSHGGVAEWSGDESASVESMKSDLRNLVVAEEAFFADSVKYTARLGTGGLNFSASPGSTTRIVVTADGWAASIGSPRTRTRCVIFIGSTAIPPANEEGVPVCVAS